MLWVSWAERCPKQGLRSRSEVVGTVMSFGAKEVNDVSKGEHSRQEE